LFNPRSEIEKENLNDPEFVEYRRMMRLLALESLYIKLSTVATLEEDLRKWKEAAGRHAWGLNELLNRVDVPIEILEAINTDQLVNMTDPDFSFYDWLGKYSDARRQSQFPRI
jgi:hypothetical protein